MLYDEKIEALISVALTDGVLTEKEKQVLFKRAQAQGIDLDEFEMVLDARLVELQKAEKAKAAASAPKSNKFGEVKKCPNCGAIVPAFSTNCPDCGYEFGGISTTSAAKELADKIDRIYEEAKKQKEDLRKNGNLSQKPGFFRLVDSQLTVWNIDSQTESRIRSTIQHFPIPTTKADLFEFIVAMQTHEDDAYQEKYNEALDKAECLFHTDPLFAKLIQERKEKLEKEKIEAEKEAIKWSKREAREARQKFFLILIPFILAATAISLEWIYLDWHWGWILFVSIITFIVVFLVCLFIYLIFDLL